MTQVFPFLHAHDLVKKWKQTTFKNKESVSMGLLYATYISFPHSGASYHTLLRRRRTGTWLHSWNRAKPLVGPSSEDHQTTLLRTGGPWRLRRGWSHPSWCVLVTTSTVTSREASHLIQYYTVDGQSNDIYSYIYIYEIFNICVPPKRRRFPRSVSLLEDTL